jgi:hypothetical protein
VEWELARKPKYSEKTCPSATLSTTNPIWLVLVSNPGRRGGKPVTNRLNYSTAVVPCKWRGYDRAIPAKCQGPDIKWEYGIKLNPQNDLQWETCDQARAFLEWI